MPEGDSLARVERQLGPLLTGRRLVAAQLRVPALATVDLAGRTVTAVTAYGKHLFMGIDGADVLHSHLMMEGRWTAVPRGQRWPAPAAKVRAVLETENATVLGIELGLLESLDRPGAAAVVHALGPDPIHRWDAERALELITADPLRPAGLALLDQRVVAGVGNIFRSESLFVAGVHPLDPVGAVPQERLSLLLDTAARQLQQNAKRPTRRTTGPTSRERYYVYGRAGRPCVRGHARIESLRQGDPALQRGRVGGNAANLTAVEREVFVCPVCQPRLAVPA